LNFGGSLSRQQGEKEQKETFSPSLRYLHSQDSNTGPNSHLSTDAKENAKKWGQWVVPLVAWYMCWVEWAGEKEMKVNTYRFLN
jgi:hypothetical protein